MGRYLPPQAMKPANLDGTWKQRTRRFSIGWLCALCLCAEPLFAQAKPVSILTEEWAPYNYMDNGKLVGFSVEIVEEILKDLRLDCPIRFLPGMRASRILNTQPRTMMITMLRTPARETQYKWIGPLGEDAIYFYKKKGGTLDVASLEDAKKVRRVACRNAGLVHDALLKNGFANLDTFAADGPAIYRKLLAGRCDLGVSDAPLGVKHLLKEWHLPLDTLVQTSVKIVESPLYIACSKDLPDSEIVLWQKSLDKMKKAGTYATIRSKYGE